MIRTCTLLLLAALSYGAPLLCTSSNDYLFILNVHTPKSSRINGLSAYFQGKPYDLSKGSAILDETKKRFTFSLIIGEVFEPHVQNKIIASLKRVPENPYLWYDLTLDIEQTKKDGTLEPCYIWHIKEKKADQQPLKIPEHGIILQAHPDIIDKVNQTHLSSINENIIYLPTIFIKENITLDESSLLATMSSIELRTLHPNKPYKTIIQNSCAATTLYEKAFCPS